MIRESGRCIHREVVQQKEWIEAIQLKRKQEINFRVYHYNRIGIATEHYLWPADTSSNSSANFFGLFHGQNLLYNRSRHRGRTACSVCGKITVLSDCTIYMCEDYRCRMAVGVS